MLGCVYKNSFFVIKISHIYILLAVLNLVGQPLVAGLSELLGMGSTSFSIFMRLIILSLSLLLIGITLGNRVKFVRGLFWIPLIVFWFAYLLRIYVDTSFDMKVLSRDVNDYWYWAVGACFVPMLGMLTYQKINYFIKSYKVCLAMLILASFLVAFLGTGSYTNEFGISVDIGRLNIKSLNPISVGHLGLSLILLSIWPFIYAGKLSFGYKKIVNIAAGLLGLYLLLASASRGPLITLIFVLVFYFTGQNIRRYWKILPVFALFFVIVTQGAQYIEDDGSYRVLSRSEGAFSGEDVAVLGRQLAYLGAINQFTQSPIYGSSLEEKITRKYPHNVVLESFMATGLIGGLSFLFLILYGFYISYKIVKMKHEHGWISLIFMQYLIAAQFSGALYLATVMWTFLAINIALYSSRNHASDNL